MSSHKEGVRVHHPHQLMGPKHHDALLQELTARSETQRLRLVLNCSGLVHLDRSATFCCFRVLRSP